jgi:uncharacterized ion transporter superfamily protein YfcC
LFLSSMEGVSVKVASVNLILYVFLAIHILTYFIWTNCTIVAITLQLVGIKYMSSIDLKSLPWKCLLMQKLLYNHLMYHIRHRITPQTKKTYSTDRFINQRMKKKCRNLLLGFSSDFRVLQMMFILHVLWAEPWDSCKWNGAGIRSETQLSLWQTHFHYQGPGRDRGVWQWRIYC